jgi:hypothetical protein
MVVTRLLVERAVCPYSLFAAFSWRVLALENEIPLDRIVVFKVDVLAQRGIIHLEFRRLRYIRGGTGNGREYRIVKRCYVTVGTTERFHLTVSDTPYPQVSLALFDLERDGRALHGNNLANQLY